MVNNQNNISIVNFLKSANASDTRRGLIPMELGAGWPAITIKNKQICVTVPYFLAQPGHGGQFLLFPISYLITLKWPNAQIVEFASLKYQKAYKGLDFSKPVGIFKHETVMGLSRDQYIAKRGELFALYDELIVGITEKRGFERLGDMRDLFQTLMEPSLYPMYRNIAPNFFECYCGLK
jgi:hypothetical protein